LDIATLLRESTLDELPALATRDAGGVLDFFDRQWTMVAVRTRDVVWSFVDDHVEHVLPDNQGFLVHRESPFVSTPSSPIE
jgi:hypothetical protein